MPKLIALILKIRFFQLIREIITKKIIILTNVTVKHYYNSYAYITKANALTYKGAKRKQKKNDNIYFPKIKKINYHHIFTGLSRN